MNTLGIKGEPPKGVIYEDPEEGITLVYDPNWKSITFLSDDGYKYDHMDCSQFSDWSEVLQELRTEYGIDICK